ncbi:alpha-mannosidase [Paenibacillus sp. GCM10012306]|uniref:alpha-mannosidase n=1 Tax=Paenibacillus sp. GCM10012306 TaxID=3317342 RepID=UPI00360D9675
MTASNKTVVHVISHTHWDREWYMPYEAHHVKLIETIDTLIETFESDPDFKSFYLDGQTIVVEDYLQVYPEKREIIQRLCDEGKLSLGPWYILQDEFLTSGEANVRNLQIGHRDASTFGPISKLGYFPDSFGNMGQAAQILQQAGISTAVFGRGVKATGFNNRVEDASGLESPYSELIWQSPDGSSVLGILFANWYNNGMEIPVDPEAAKAYWDIRLERARQYASTRHLLLMNGCDHQPIQTDLSEALRVARELYPDCEFIHSNFDDYVKAVKEELPEDLTLTTGELRGQHTDGWYSLVNTASARVYIKQLNQQNQTLLEKTAEPLAALAHGLGKPYPHGLLQYAWKTLMQNHPHDSICGCSVDEVYHEMKTRFAKSIEVGSSLATESAKFISSKVDTSVFASYGDQAVPFVVYNTSGYASSGTVTVEVEWSRRFFNQSEDPVAVFNEVVGRTHGEGYLVNAAGVRLDVTAEDLGVRFGYELPGDKFRQPYMARALRLTFEADNLPALGLASYAWIPSKAANTEQEPQDVYLVTGDLTMENEHIQVSLEQDGSFSLLDKASGQLYSGLGIYEDVGDIGNEYIFKQPIGDTAITSRGVQAEITLVEDTPYRAAFVIQHTLQIPASANELLQQEIDTMVEFRQRQATRSQQLVPLHIVTRISLERSSQALHVHTRIDNHSKDHRLRVLLPSGVQSAVHYADSVFEVAERQTVPAPEWENPSNCQHMQSFIDVHEDGRGLTAAGKGLNEYEVLRDAEGTIAVTLLRSVGELGDWGVFHTPDAQCLGVNEAEWSIIPHRGGDTRFDAYREAYRFAVPLITAQTDIHEGELPPVHNFLTWEGKGLAFSNLKLSEGSGDLMARWYNLAETSSELSIHASEDVVLYTSNIMEQHTSDVLEQSLPVSKAGIVTVGISSR